MDQEFEYIASQDQGEPGEVNKRRRNILSLVWKRSCCWILIGHIVMNVVAMRATNISEIKEEEFDKFMNYLQVIAIALFGGVIFRSLVGIGFVSAEQRPIL